jgi:peptide/nickel transport system substrate-binding protein
MDISKKVYIPVFICLFIMSCQTKQPENQLNVAVIGIESLNPFRCNSSFDTRVLSQVYSTLVRTGKEGKYIPDLAHSWECTDGINWTFYLRKNVFFHDGNEIFPEGKARKVVASDVKFSYEMMIEARTKATRARNFRHISKVEIIDDHTIRFTTSKPLPYFLSFTQGIGCLFIVSHEMVEKHGIDNLQDFHLGSGPFEFRKYIPDEYIYLERNEDYWIKPRLERIMFKIIPSITTSEIGLEMREVDMVFGMRVNTVKRLEKNKNFVHLTGLYGDLSIFAFNTRDERFSDIRVRRAIALALDKDKILRPIYGKYAFISCNFISPGHPGHDSNLTKKCLPNVEEAKKLLQEADWTINSKGVYSKGPLTLDFSIVVLNRQEFVLMTNLAAAQLRKIGIIMRPVPLEFGTWINRIHRSDLEMYWDNGYYDEYALFELFHSKSEFPGTGWHNKKIDELINQAMEMMDEEKRGQLWKKIQNLVLPEFVYIPIGHAYPIMTFHRRVNDFVYYPNWYLNLTTIENNVWLERQK